MLAVPNFSEGRDAGAIAAICAGFDRAELLDRHSDEVHNRSVLSVAAGEVDMVGALVGGARACIDWVDMPTHTGAHPCIGALDVCPVVYTDADGREPAQAVARELGPALAELGLPVFLYGELASSADRRERSFFRRGGLGALRERMASGELRADFGPEAPHPSAGAVLVTARPPLAAFNLELDTPSMAIASVLASELRESGGGPPGVRAIAVELPERAQVSTNVNDPVAVPLATVVERAQELASSLGTHVVAAEVVGLLPEAALRGFPDDLPIRDFDPQRRLLERRL